MSFEVSLGLVLTTVGAIGLIVTNLNPQWIGFTKIKKKIRAFCRFTS